MKNFSLTISIASFILSPFLLANDSQASPPKIINVTGQEFHHLTKRDFKTPTSISKQNEFLTKDLGLQLNTNEIKKSTSQIKIAKASSETSNSKFVQTEFKNTFKDVGSTYTSNYGPVTRAPDESLKYCTSKACLE